MKIFKCYLIFIFSIISTAQPSGIEWQKSFGGSGTENATASIQTASGEYVTIGNTNSNDGNVSNAIGLQDAWIVKYDSNGHIIWEHTFGGTQIDDVTSIKQTSDGGFIIVGSTFSSDGHITTINRGNGDLWVFKINSLGVLEWQKTFGGSLNDVAASISLTDTGFIVIGTTQSSDGDIIGQHGVSDFWVLNFDLLGNVIWKKNYGGNSQDIGKHVVQTRDGGFIITGHVTSSISGDITTQFGMIDIWVVKLDYLGNIEWQKSYGGSGYERSETILQTTDSGYIIGGETSSFDGDVHFNHSTSPDGYSDFWILKIDVAGNIQWEKTIGGNQHENAFHLQICSDGNYMIGGFRRSNDGDILHFYGNTDYFLAKLDTEGNLLWTETYGGTEFDQLISFQETNDQGIRLVGTSYSNDGNVTGNHGLSDIWVLKLLPEQLSVSNVHKSAQSISPNPVNETLNISTLETLSSCQIYDNYGRRIKYSQGKQSIDVSQLMPGIYILKTNTASGKIFTSKFIKS